MPKILTDNLLFNSKDQNIATVFLIFFSGKSIFNFYYGLNREKTLLFYILTISLLNLIITNVGGGVEGCVCFYDTSFFILIKLK